MKGDIVCAVEPCMGTMEGESDSCVALPPPEGSCCPTEYRCGRLTHFKNESGTNNLRLTSHLLCTTECFAYYFWI